VATSGIRLPVSGIHCHLLSAFCFLLSTPPVSARIGVEFQMPFGNPSAATADTNNHQHFLIQRDVQALDYSDALGLPRWAAWSLTAADIGTNARSTYATDTSLPANFYRVKPADYDGSSWDRGHLCPSKDRTDTPEHNDAVFLMSNFMPQSGRNNSGVWLQFENYCRDLVQSSSSNELLIVCGPGGFSGARLNTDGPVAIPSFTWKLVVVCPPGADSATNRVTATNRVIAVKIPNDDTATNAWPAYVTSANQIQVDTGLTFFTALPADVAAALRARVDGQTNPPPAIVDFAPASGAVGSAVVLTGTNFTLASAVTFNGTPAAFTVDSPSQITATVPTNGGSGFLSVSTPSGTAISTNSFAVLGGSGVVFTGTLAAWDFSGLNGGLNNYGPSPFAPAQASLGLSVGGLVRGAGVRVAGNAAARGWGGVGFTNTTATAAVAAGRFATFTLTASNGYSFSATRLSRLDYYRSATGATNALLQVQVGATAFTNLANVSFPTAGIGARAAAVDLSGVDALQDVPAGVPVTFRLVPLGGSGSSGTWYLYDTAASPAADLVLEGTVIALTPQAEAPQLSPPTVLAGQFHLTLTGTPGAAYVIETKRNLSVPAWTPVATNTAPFTYTAPASRHPAQFFRARLP
jgi:endonuclease G